MRLAHFLALASLAVGSSTSASAAFSWSKTKYLFSFGDSYTKTGWEPAGGRLSADPGQTAAGGPNWIEYLTGTFNKSDILLRNFAYGGATIDSSLVVPYLSTVQSLASQVDDEFLPLFSPPPSDVPWTGQNSLFSTWIGINDVGNLYSWTNVSHSGFNKRELEEWYSLQLKLYGAGARNFLHLSVPPTWRTPQFADQGSTTVAAVKITVKDFNSQLRKFSDKLKTVHPDANVLFYDAETAFGKILDRAPYEAFKNWTGWCDTYNSATSPTEKDAACPYSLNEYFWLNNYHPTWPVHRLLAQDLAGKLLASQN